jgi:DNA uptake protein ComE-like DNA-binding protein
MVQHSNSETFFRKPAFIGISFFGGTIFLLLQIIYWQSIYAREPLTLVHFDSMLNIPHKHKKDMQWNREFSIYPSTALKILKAIKKNPHITSLRTLEAETRLDSAILMQTLLGAAAQIPPKKYVIDMNRADSSEWENLPGIGGKTARRILRYRERLGGFISKFQLLEIKYFDSSLLLSDKIDFAIDTNLIRKININECDIIELYKHPYIGKELAKRLWEFRKVHYPLTSSKVQMMRSMPIETSIKLNPYLDFSSNTK